MPASDHELFRDVYLKYLFLLTRSFCAIFEEWQLFVPFLF